MGLMWEKYKSLCDEKFNLLYDLITNLAITFKQKGLYFLPFSALHFQNMRKGYLTGIRILAKKETLHQTLTMTSQTINLFTNKRNIVITS